MDCLTDKQTSDKQLKNFWWKERNYLASLSKYYLKNFRN